MIHDAFITHLQGAGLGVPVRAAFTTEPVTDYSEDFPVILVYPTADELAPSEADNFVIQQQTTQVAAMIGCKYSELSAVVLAFRAAAQGWVAGAPWDALEVQVPLKACAASLSGGARRSPHKDQSDNPCKETHMGSYVIQKDGSRKLVHRTESARKKKAAPAAVPAAKPAQTPSEVTTDENP